MVIYRGAGGDLFLFLPESRVPQTEWIEGAYSRDIQGRTVGAYSRDIQGRTSNRDVQ